MSQEHKRNIGNNGGEPSSDQGKPFKVMRLEGEEGSAGEKVEITRPVAIERDNSGEGDEVVDGEILEIDELEEGEDGEGVDGEEVFEDEYEDEDEDEDEETASGSGGQVGTVRETRQPNRQAVEVSEGVYQSPLGKTIFRPVEVSKEPEAGISPMDQIVIDQAQLRQAQMLYLALERMAKERIPGYGQLTIQEQNQAIVSIAEAMFQVRVDAEKAITKINGLNALQEIQSNVAGASRNFITARTANPQVSDALARLIDIIGHDMGDSLLRLRDGGNGDGRVEGVLEQIHKDRVRRRSEKGLSAQLVARETENNRAKNVANIQAESNQKSIDRRGAVEGWGKAAGSLVESAGTSATNVIERAGTTADSLTRKLGKVFSDAWNWSVGQGSSEKPGAAGQAVQAAIYILRIPAVPAGVGGLAGLGTGFAGGLLLVDAVGTVLGTGPGTILLTLATLTGGSAGAGIGAWLGNAARQVNLGRGIRGADKGLGGPPRGGRGPTRSEGPYPQRGGDTQRGVVWPPEQAMDRNGGIPDDDGEGEEGGLNQRSPEPRYHSLTGRGRKF